MTCARAETLADAAVQLRRLAVIVPPDLGGLVISALDAVEQAVEAAGIGEVA